MYTGSYQDRKNADPGQKSRDSQGDPDDKGHHVGPVLQDRLRSGIIVKLHMISHLEGLSAAGVDIAAADILLSAQFIADDRIIGILVPADDLGRLGDLPDIDLNDLTVNDLQVLFLHHKAVGDQNNARAQQDRGQTDHGLYLHLLVGIIGKQHAEGTADHKLPGIEQLLILVRHKAVLAAAGLFQNPQLLADRILGGRFDSLSFLMAETSRPMP